MQDRRRASVDRSYAWRRGAGAGIGLAAAVTMVALMMGGAAAAPVLFVASSVKDVAPYAGAGYGLVLTDFSGCSATGAIPVVPSFNGTSGEAFGSANASVKGCGPANDSAVLEMASEWESTTFTTTSGSHTVTANWVATFAVSLDAKAVGTGAHASAEFVLWVETSLFDVSNSSTVSGGPTLVTNHTITSGTYSHTYSKISASGAVSAKLKKTSQYDWLTEFVFYVFAFVTPGSSSASASLSMGTSADHATLESVVIS